MKIDNRTILKAIYNAEKEMAPEALLKFHEERLKKAKPELDRRMKHGIIGDETNKLMVTVITDEIIIDAVGKQIAKEPYFIGDGYDGDGDIVYDTATCPTCCHTFFDGDEGWHCKCCIQCGQALDWSDKDE